MRKEKNKQRKEWEKGKEKQRNNVFGNCSRIHIQKLWVPSQFSKETLTAQGINASKIDVVPAFSSFIFSLFLFFFLFLSFVLSFFSFFKAKGFFVSRSSFLCNFFLLLFFDSPYFLFCFLFWFPYFLFDFFFDFPISLISYVFLSSFLFVFLTNLDSFSNQYRAL